MPKFILVIKMNELSASFLRRDSFCFSHLEAGACQSRNIEGATCLKTVFSAVLLCYDVTIQLRRRFLMSFRILHVHMSTCKTPSLLKTTQNFNSWQNFCLPCRAVQTCEKKGEFFLTNWQVACIENKPAHYHKLQVNK